MRRAVSLVWLLVAVGCGRSTTPSPPASVVDGLTGAPVPGEVVAAGPGQPVTVARPGYLRRDTLVPRDRIITLWPITVDEGYVRTLVYSDAVSGNRLLRWPAASVPVARDLPVEVTPAVQAWVSLVPSDAPALTVAVDPTDPGWARLGPDSVGFALVEVANADGHIVSARLVFKSAADMRQPGNLLHEVGHALGLQHSPRLVDLMFATNARSATTFSADERTLLTMMYKHRRAGQIPPDDDRNLGATAGGTSALRLVD
jgi:hypothetical protein